MPYSTIKQRKRVFLVPEIAPKEERRVLKYASDE